MNAMVPENAEAQLRHDVRHNCPHIPNTILAEEREKISNLIHGFVGQFNDDPQEFVSNIENNFAGLDSTMAALKRSTLPRDKVLLERMIAERVLLDLVFESIQKVR